MIKINYFVYSRVYFRFSNFFPRYVPPRYLFTFLFFRLMQGALILLDRDFPVFILAIRRLDSTCFTSFRITAAARAAVTWKLASSSVQLVFLFPSFSFTQLSSFFYYYLSSVIGFGVVCFAYRTWIFWTFTSLVFHLNWHFFCELKITEHFF